MRTLSLIALLLLAVAVGLGGRIIYDHKVELDGRYDILVSGSGKIVLHSADGWTQQFAFKDGEMVNGTTGETVLHGFDPASGAQGSRSIRLIEMPRYGTDMELCYGTNCLGFSPTTLQSCESLAVDGWYYSDLEPGLVSRVIACSDVGHSVLSAIHCEETKPCEDTRITLHN